MKQMNLVQKLPIGLSLACVMMMTSCSQEDVQTPEPEVMNERSESSMKLWTGYTLITPTLAKTNGPWGKNHFAEHWQRDVAAGSDNIQAYPAGTSSLKSLWGNDSYPFVKALPEIPGITDMRGILTVTTQTIVAAPLGVKSIGKTTIKNMVPGHKYQVKYYVACALPAETEQGKIPVFTDKVLVSLRYNAPGKTQFSGNYGITSLVGKHAEWVTQTITFTAEDTEVDFLFSASTKNPGQFSYAHIYVDNNSLKKVN